ncbi:J domain-containing protein [Salinilacihabitans rarus]|uniref:J domain-containing protein n=1 Tax=Salinilacihabitans rarus TaxID=2961596 RepID=UPI0020C87430|nr:DnaJ domain-containing protein [Salinilacihabitans rarus]
MAETYYDVLGVPRDASTEEIRAAYRERVLETHPDHNDDPDAAEQFGRVREAEAVLTDEDERTRYDRLGHEAYLGVESDDEGVAGTGGGTGGDGSWSVAEAAARAAERSASEADDGGPSHHARQRSRRRRATSGTEWQFGTDSSSDVSAGRARAKTTSTDRTRTTAGGSRAEGEGFSYSVHGWDDEVDFADERPPIDQSIAITAGAVALFYPLLVYGSLTPAFPLWVNLVVAACTLVLVGSLLTVPRAALTAFGVWSVLTPLALVWHPAVGPFSPIGLLALAATWVPLGYAVAVWWAVRP